MVLVLPAVFFLESCFSNGGTTGSSDPGTEAETEVRGLDVKRLKSKAEAARAYCKANKLNLDICLLADLSIHSGKKRMVVWSFAKDTVIHSGLVSHGCGAQPWGKDRSKKAPVFSNEENSHCSSPGKYRMGARGYSQWGTHTKYLMHGLEKTNSNAMKREIVFHGWDAIADEEVYPDGTPEGWGCPAVSNTFMATVDDLLKAKQQPVLFWIFE